MSSPKTQERRRADPADSIQDATRTTHLEWSDKQRRILTAHGKAVEYYTADRGFPFDETELPHFWLSLSSSSSNATTTNIWDKFLEWRTSDTRVLPVIIGAWKRPLFYGGWEHSTDENEHVYNVQTGSLFVDLRLPVTRLTKDSFPSTAVVVRSLDDLSGDQLRLYARQHCFAGYSYVQDASSVTCSSAVVTKGFQQVCARHHCIDWNYVGTPRNRPNKWWIQIPEIDQQQQPPTTVQLWKEWAFATDDIGQHYYCERWERLPSPSFSSAVLAFYLSDGRGGVLVVANDHFNYCLGRSNTTTTHPQQSSSSSSSSSSLIDTVDECVRRGDLDMARMWLSIQGGHGHVSQGWNIDAAVEFWREGTPLWYQGEVRLSRDPTTIDGENSNVEWWESCTLYWKEEPWKILECNLGSLEELDSYLQSSLTKCLDE